MREVRAVSGMAEVLAAHGIYGMSAGTHSACRCNREWVTHAEYRAHLEAELSAAGFGPVKEAKAEARKVKRIRGELKSLGKHLDSWESQGHATVTIRFLRFWIADRTAELSKS